MPRCDAYCAVASRKSQRLLPHNLKREEQELVVLGKERKRATVALSDMMAGALSRLEVRPNGRKRSTRVAYGRVF